MTLAAIILSSVSAAQAWPPSPHRRSACGRRPAPALCKLHWWVDHTWSLEAPRGIPPTRYWYSAERHPGEAPWVARRVAWRSRARRVRLIPLAPWPQAWYADAMCVHHYEGAWTDPNAPYWGGLQMDMAFQEAYGAEFLARYGTADHWPPRDQLVAALRAWRARGWTPWPNTAAMCGLL